jgi:hypothetical protein
VVTGIATSFSATLDVFHRAAACRKNLIIVHEPTFYNHLDETKDLNKKKPSSRLDKGVVAKRWRHSFPCTSSFLPTPVTERFIGSYE